MFVSSYSTYIQTNNSDKVAKQKIEQQNFAAKPFSTHLSKEVPATNSQTSSLPIDYISKNVVLNNKHELEKQQSKANDSTKANVGKFQSKNSLLNAQSAYQSNSTMFSLFTLPQVALSQTPSLENTLPKEPMDIKESNMRHTMVNTYIANDNYYKVTA